MRPLAVNTRENLLERLRLRHLRLLALVAEHGSLSAAATVLRLSQPAATNMLRDLEAAFGAPLIARSAAGSTLTPAGEIALERLRLALGAVQRAVESLAGTSHAPIVHIGMIPAVGVRTLPQLVRALTARDQLPRLVLHEATVPVLIDKLARGEIDCMIGRLDFDSGGSGLTGDLVIETLGREQLGVASAPGHELARRRGVTRQELQAAQWVAAGRDARTRQYFDAYFHDAGMAAPAPRIESYSFHSNLCLVEETDMLTIAPMSAITYYASMGRVRALALAHPFPVSNQLFARRRDTTLPALEHIVQALRDILAAQQNQDG